MKTTEYGAAFTSLLRVVIALTLTAGVTSNANATLGVVAYYAATGNLVVEEAPGLIISGIAIEGPQPFNLHPDDLGGFVDVSGNGVYWLFFTLVQAPLELNSILPAGLTPLELQTDYSAFVHIPTGDYVPYPPAAWRYVAVPEPATGGLAIMGLSGAFAFRRGRSTGKTTSR